MWRSLRLAPHPLRWVVPGVVSVSTNVNRGAQAETPVNELRMQQSHYYNPTNVVCV